MFFCFTKKTSIKISDFSFTDWSISRVLASPQIWDPLNPQHLGFLEPDPFVKWVKFNDMKVVCGLLSKRIVFNDYLAIY